MRFLIKSLKIKQFYESITWNSDYWDTKLNDHFHIVLKSLFSILTYQKVYRIKLLKRSFFKIINPPKVSWNMYIFCVKSNVPGKYKNKCFLCSPVSFYNSELYYYENFHVGLTCREIKIVKNLYRNRVFGFFGSVPNDWFRRLNTNYMHIHYYKQL